jgi:aspartyl-tRNA(Asn)/glutamyl-tRNA(Gln) amidotransferase subunit C
MEVTDELIDNLSDLARLEFNTADKEKIRKDLQRMVLFVEKLGELDTTGVEPLLHMSPETNILRDDVPGGSVNRAAALSNAPATDGTYFKVPKVIRKS